MRPPHAVLIDEAKYVTEELTGDMAKDVADDVTNGAFEDDLRASVVANPSFCSDR